MPPAFNKREDGAAVAPPPTKQPFKLQIRTKTMMAVITCPGVPDFEARTTIPESVFYTTINT